MVSAGKRDGHQHDPIFQSNQIKSKPGVFQHHHRCEYEHVLYLLSDCLYFYRTNILSAQVTKRIKFCWLVLRKINKENLNREKRENTAKTEFENNIQIEKRNDLNKTHRIYFIFLCQIRLKKGY
jgi:hypothetical protein